MCKRYVVIEPFGKTKMSFGLLCAAEHYMYSKAYDALKGKAHKNLSLLEMQSYLSGTFWDGILSERYIEINVKGIPLKWEIIEENYKAVFE